MDGTMLGVLRDFESTVITFWRAVPGLSDHAVARVYETAFQAYGAEQRGRRAFPHKLSGDDLVLFEQIRAAADYRLGRGPCPASCSAGVPTQELATIVKCLGELGKSVRSHAVNGGRQPYLQYVSQFLPPAK